MSVLCFCPSLSLPSSLFSQLSLCLYCYSLPLPQFFLHRTQFAISLPWQVHPFSSPGWLLFLSILFSLQSLYPLLVFRSIAAVSFSMPRNLLFLLLSSSFQLSFRVIVIPVHPVLIVILLSILLLFALPTSTFSSPHVMLFLFQSIVSSLFFCFIVIFFMLSYTGVSFYSWLHRY